MDNLGEAGRRRWICRCRGAMSLPGACAARICRDPPHIRGSAHRVRSSSDISWSLFRSEESRTFIVCERGKACRVLILAAALVRMGLVQ